MNEAKVLKFHWRFEAQRRVESSKSSDEWTRASFTIERFSSISSFLKSWQRNFLTIPTDNLMFSSKVSSLMKQLQQQRLKLHHKIPNNQQQTPTAMLSFLLRLSGYNNWCDENWVHLRHSFAYKFTAPSSRDKNQNWQRSWLGCRQNSNSFDWLLQICHLRFVLRQTSKTRSEEEKGNFTQQWINWNNE